MPVALPKTASIAEAQAAGANGAIPLDDLPNDYTPLWQRGCQLWLAADRITGLADASPVTTWSDLSGNGRDATQATAGAKPTFKPGIIGGKPVVRFDGIDDYLGLSSGLDILKNVGGGTIFTVFQTTSAAQQWMVYADTGSGTTRATSLINRTAGQFGAGGRRLDTDAFAAVAGGVVSVSTPYIHVSLFNWSGAQLSVFVNGSQQVIGDPFQTAGNSDNTNSLHVWIGAGTSFLTGDIAEVVVYNRALPAAERVRVECYLGREYGIRV